MELPANSQAFIPTAMGNTPLSEIPEMREQIACAARKRFEVYGFSKATMEEIAEDLHISKKTLYKNFSSKEDLVRFVVHQFMHERRCEIDSVLNDPKLSLIQKLRALMTQVGIQTSKVSPRVISDIAVSAPELWKEVLAFQAERIEMFGHLIRDGIHQGQLRTDLDEELVMKIYFGAMQSVIDPTNFAEARYTPKQAISTLIAVLFEGMLTPTARKEYAKQKQ